MEIDNGGPRPTGFDVPYGISGEYTQDYSCNGIKATATFYRTKLTTCNGFKSSDFDPNNPNNLDPNSAWYQTTYPRTQNGRFNTDPSKDTKSRPVIMRGVEYGSFDDMDINPDGTKKKNFIRSYDNVKKTRQSGNLFPNTYTMTKSEKRAFILRNKSALRR
jgi:hypothetical protein